MKPRFSIRLHWFLMIAATVLFGNVAGKGLIHLGMDSLLRRNLVVALLSYCFLFLALKIWIHFIKRLGVDATHLAKTVAASGEEKKKSSSGHFDFFDLWSFDEPLFVIGIVLIGFVAIFFLGSFLLVDGPIFLAEAAFEIALGSTVIKSSLRDNDSALERLYFRRTFVPFGFFLLLMAGVMMTAERDCPGAVRLAEVIERCWLK